MRFLFAVSLVALGATAAAGQSPAAPATQIAAAVLPLPAEMRAGARVLGYDARGALVELRAGSGMVCLAANPKATNFHVACYHESLEPFMARGRALRAQGVDGAQVDTVRYREVAAGTLPMPKGPAMLYSISAPSPTAFDAAKGTVTGGSRLYVTYVPFATPQSTGISAVPKAGEPWLMFPGTPKAHIMYAAGM